MNKTIIFYFMRTLAVAGIGGFLFKILYIPLPWMLGPLTSVMLWSLLTKQSMYWPLWLRNAGLIILGYMMGISFTAETGQQILIHLPSMFVSTTLIILFSLLLGYLVGRRTGISRSTSLIGSIPGGLSQMVVLSEEVPGSDVTVVTFMQTIRLLTVVFVVPLLATHVLAAGPEQSVFNNSLTVNPLPLVGPGGSVKDWLIIIAATLVSTWVAVRYNFPTPYLLGPLLGAVGLVLAGRPGPLVPNILILAAQLCIGTYMGLTMNIASLKAWKQLLPYTLAGSIGIVLVSLMVGYFLTCFYPLTLVTAFLSTAPGGMTEMGVTAMTVNADLSIVTAYQMFRVLFILLVVPWVLKSWLIVKSPHN
jgi:membrane AbrB-like protein